MIKKLILVFAVLAMFYSPAQENAASPYSFYGIGSLKFRGTVENRSMGGLSVFTDSIHLNLRNPAGYTGNNLQVAPFSNESRPVKFTVGGSATSSNYKSDAGEDKANAATFDYLALAFPMGKFGAGFGLIPYTAVGYRLESNGTVNGEEATLNRYNGEGGLNRAFMGLAYQFTPAFSLGIDAGYNFGNITNSSVAFNYDDEGELLQYQSQETNQSELRGFTYTIGGRYTPMINEKLQLSVAGSFSPKSELSADNKRVFATVLFNETTGQFATVNEIDEDLSAEGLDKTTINLPTKTSFGVGIGEPRKWFVGGEYTFLKTSQFSHSVFDIENATFEDASTFSVGGFFIPRYTSFNNYWKRLVYRAGLRYEKTGLKINDESINEFGISFGVGLPVGRLFSNANIGLEIGRRGTTSQNLIQENFLEVQLSLSLNDRWFVKRKFN